MADPFIEPEELIEEPIQEEAKQAPSLRDLKEKKDQYTKKQAQKSKQGHDQIGKLHLRGSAQDKKEQLKEEIKEKAKQKVKQLVKDKLKQTFNKQTLKLAAQAVKVAVREALLAIGAALAPYTGFILAALGIILLIIGIIVIIWVMYSNSPANGGGPSLTGGVSQVYLLDALSGGRVGTQQQIKTVIKSERERYQRIQDQMKNNPSTLKSGVDYQTNIKALTVLFDQADRESTTPKTAQVTLKKAGDLEKQIESQLPFGQWLAIAAKAAGTRKDSTSVYAPYTKLQAKDYTKGCATVVSGLMVSVGIPIKAQAGVEALWYQPALATVVETPSVLDKTLAKNSLSQLKEGDIVIWNDPGSGNEKCKGNTTTCFNHIGIFIGGDTNNVVDNSSSQLKVRIGNLVRKQVFNGAKRYAP